LRGRLPGALLQAGLGRAVGAAWVTPSSTNVKCDGRAQRRRHFSGGCSNRSLPNGVAYDSPRHRPGPSVSNTNQALKGRPKTPKNTVPAPAGVHEDDSRFTVFCAIFA